jgi:hypothetical protein
MTPQCIDRSLYLDKKSTLDLETRWNFFSAGHSPAYTASLAQEGRQIERFRVFTHGSYSEIVSLHVRVYLRGFRGTGIGVTLALAIFGKFLLGFLAGRHRLLHAPEEHVDFFRKLLTWALCFACYYSGSWRVAASGPTNPKSI